MAVLGTLVTMVTADTSGFSSGLTQAAGEAKRFSQQVGNEQLSLNDKIKQGIGNLRSDFGSLVKIGLGVDVGRAIFHTAHEGLVNLASGFADARRAGLSFGDSLGDAMKNLIGMPTLASQLAANLKLVAETAAEVDKTMSAAFTHASELRAPSAAKFASLPKGESAGLQKDIEAAMVAVNAANLASEKAKQDLAAVIDEIGGSQAQRDRGFGWSVLRAPTEAAAELGKVAADAQRKLAALQSEAAGANTETGQRTAFGRGVGGVIGDALRFTDTMNKAQKDKDKQEADSYVRMRTEIDKVVESRDRELEGIRKLNQTPWDRYFEGIARVNNLAGELGPTIAASERLRLAAQLAKETEGAQPRDNRRNFAISTPDDIRQAFQNAAGLKKEDPKGAKDLADINKKSDALVKIAKSAEEIALGLKFEFN